MLKKTGFISPAIIILLLVFYETSVAQVTITAQLRSRTELRDGYGTVLPKTAKPAFFISQRTRLGLGYNVNRLKFNISLQDVRVWGQDASTINTTTTANNNGLKLHEAWGEVLLTDTANKEKSLSLKLGRQEINYDDQRLLGSLDYAQQARAFEAALLKFETKKYLVHLGAAFNQNQQNLAGTVYNPTPPGNYPANTNGGTMYKSFGYLYANKKLEKGNLSYLFFADQFNKYSMDTLNTVVSKKYQVGAWSRATTGFYFNQTFNKLALSAAAYYQFGSNAAGQKLSAGLLSASGQYTFNKKFSMGPGVDFYSGGTSGGTNKNFDPLYGTAHKFAGLMDYYFAVSGFGNVGFVDYYLKSKYTPSDKFIVATDLHLFNSATKVVGYNNKNLGQEVDISATYTHSKPVSIEAVYCHYFSTSLLTSRAVKNVSNAKAGGNWGYITVNIKPGFLLK